MEKKEALMALIPKVKCSRCDRTYSSMKNQCPYCGTRRTKSGKRSTSEGDSKWRLVVGGLLLVAILFSIIGVINMGLKSGDGDTAASPSVSASATSSDDANAGASGENGDGGEEASPSPSPSPSPNVTSISVTWAYFRSAYEMTIAKGDSVALEATVYPTTSEAEVTWASSAPSVCSVDSTGAIKGVATGTAEVYAYVGDVESEHIIVRVK